MDGPGDARVDHVAGIAEAGVGAVTFLANRRYASHLRGCGAEAVLVASDEPRPPHAPTLLRVADPYAAFAQALGLLHPQRWPVPGVHPRAVVAEDAVVEGVFVDACAVVGPGATVGPGSWLEPGAVVGAGARVGPGCRLGPHSVVADGCVLGARVRLNAGAVVGGDGYGFAPTPAGLQKIPQLGGVVVGDDVELGANTCVDRAALPRAATVVGSGSKLDNLVQVGHGATLGERVRMVAFSGVAGSSRLGDDVVLAAKAAVLGHRDVGDRAQVGVSGVVHRDVAEEARVSGLPAIDHRLWLRASAALKELPGLLAEVRALRRRVAALEEAAAEE